MFAIVSMVESCMSEATSLTVIVHLHLSMKHKTSLFCIGPEQNWNKKRLRLPWRKIPWHEEKNTWSQTARFSQFTFLSHLFHVSTGTKGSSVDFSLHLGNRVSQLRVTPCWMKSTPSTAASLQPSFASQLSSTQQLVWAPWRLAKQTAARNGARRFDVLWPLNRQRW